MISPRAALLSVTLFSLQAADLTQPTAQAFARYIGETEKNLHPFDANFDERAHLRSGAKTVTPSTPPKVPGGLVEDLTGRLFLPNTTLAKVRSILQDYPNYPTTFAPEIIDARILAHQPDHFDVALRLFKKQFITVVLNSAYRVDYTQPDPTHLAIHSRSTRIAEVRRAKPPYTDELPPGHDSGFLWNLNSYWQFEEADGGVYAQCQAVSLSRDVPFGLAFIRKFVERFPRESMDRTLESLRKASAVAVLKPN